MKVKLEVGPDTNVSVETDEADNIVSITFGPKFASKGAQTTLAYGASVSDGGKVLDRFSVVVSGASGRVSKKSRASTVTALVDMPEPSGGA